MSGNKQVTVYKRSKDLPPRCQVFIKSSSRSNMWDEFGTYDQLLIFNPCVIASTHEALEAGHWGMKIMTHLTVLLPVSVRPLAPCGCLLWQNYRNKNCSNSGSLHNPHIGTLRRQAFSIKTGYLVKSFENWGVSGHGYLNIIFSALTGPTS